MYDPDSNASPVNPLPPLVIILAILIGAAEIVFQLGENGLAGGPAGFSWRSTIADRFGFPTGVVEWMWVTQNFPLEHLLRFLTYPFIHLSFGSALFGCVMVLALGKFVGEQVGGFVFLLIFFVSAAAAALIFALIVGPRNALLGAFPAAYGLIGAYSWILLGRLRSIGENGLQAFRLIGVLLVIQLVFGVIWGGNSWIADIAGFAVGFLTCALLRPKEAEGIGYLLDRMRRR